MVSVVITTYKRELRYPKRAIASVLAQTFEDWELIVVDDSPNDYSERPIIYQYVQELNDSRIRIIQNPENYGGNKSRNIGLCEAKGEYIAYLDDDDEWAPDKLERELGRFQECSTDTAMVYGSYCKVKQDGEKQDVRLRILNGRCYEQLVSSCHNQIGSTSFPLLRIEALRTLNGFDEMISKSQDYDLWLRVARDYAIAYVEGTLGYYYLHDEEQITKDKSGIIKIKRKIIQKHEAYLKQNKKVYSTLLLQLFQMAKQYSGKWERYRIFLEASILSPYIVAQYLLAQIQCFIFSFKK